MSDEALDRTYAALADPTRRALLSALASGPARISDLAAPIPMTFAGVSRPVPLLGEAGPVRRGVSGEFLAIERPRRLDFTWRDPHWADPERDSVVTVLLEPHGDDTTEMRILHESLPPGAVEGYGPGWDLVARQLETSLASRNHP